MDGTEDHDPRPVFPASPSPASPHGAEGASPQLCGGAAELLPPAGGLSAAGSQAAGTPPDRKREKGGFVEALVLVLIALVLALTLKTYVAEAYEIKGRSMEPTFLNGQRVVVLKSFFGIERGDIIVFASSEEPGKDLIKRVIGLPGETVKIVRGKVYIDGVKIEEGYAKHDARDLRDSPREEEIREGCYYVLGDNRPDSHDSRVFQAIPVSAVKGKVVVRWWPFKEMRAF